MFLLCKWVSGYSRERIIRSRSGIEKLGQVLSRRLSLSCCVETVRREEIKVTVLALPNNLGADGHWPLTPESRQNRAEHKPLKQLLNKQSAVKAVCGISVQMPALSRAVHEQSCFPV